MFYIRVERIKIAMEKKSANMQKNDPKDVQVLNPLETISDIKPGGKQSRVKTIGDPAFEQAIDGLIQEMGNHS
jgi:hypothetical protein